MRLSIRANRSAGFIQKCFAVLLFLFASNCALQIREAQNGVPSQLVISGPSFFYTGNCPSAFTVRSVDPYGHPANVWGNSSVSLTANGGGTFYLDSLCTNAVNNVTNPVTIANASSSQIFYLKDPSAETLALTAAYPGWASGGLSVNSRNFFVQENAGPLCGSATTCPVSLTTPSVSGNLLVLAVTYNNLAASVTSITDNHGNAYVNAIPPVNWPVQPFRTEIWYAANITGGGAAITATVTLSAASTSFIAVYLNEYTGLVTTSPLDQISAATGNNTGTAISSGTKITTSARELIFGHAEGQGPVVLGGAGYAVRSTFNSNIEEDQVIMTAGPASANFALNVSGEWIALMATFKFQ